MTMMNGVAVVICVVAGAPAMVAAQESSPAACQNRVDDDGDQLVDCADVECSLFVFCASGAAYVPPRAAIPTREVSHPSWVLAGTGFGVFGLAWAGDILVTAAISTYAGSVAFSTIPVAGPFLQLDYASNGGEVAALMVSAVFQTIGLGLGILGLSIQVTDREPIYAVLPRWEPGGAALDAVARW